MSLDKAIEHGKEHRKPYYRSKAFDCSCRNHGSCEYCKDNRKHSDEVKQSEAEEAIKEFEKEDAES